MRIPARPSSSEAMPLSKYALTVERRSLSVFDDLRRFRLAEMIAHHAIGPNGRPRGLITPCPEYFGAQPLIGSNMLVPSGLIFPPAQCHRAQGSASVPAEHVARHKHVEALIVCCSREQRAGQWHIVLEEL